ncbi:hypothetical protein NQ317_006355 [Molorchus minor]|uniref:Uncharacterized protein n=1 Tax=Molorchus minor TaxID=1323400 RepID=A0ABQ9JNH6_9CUCU|nr:hypothetical protein NQ317_006355 [Molorchus minor]
MEKAIFIQERNISESILKHVHQNIHAYCSPWKDFYLKSSNYVYIDPSIDQNQDDENLCTEGTSSLSNPVYVPVKTLERDNLDRSSGTESDDSSICSVRF